MIADSKMHAWFAYNDYLCFRIDLQGSGDSEGALTGEYTDEELVHCTQVIAAIAAHPSCDGNVGMMGKSWSAINALMMAARPDRPEALKALLISCGSDNRYNDDVHYMGGAMMFDNVIWPSLPPDPAVVGDPRREIWRTRIENADFGFKQWATHQPRDAYWRENSFRDHFGDVGVPVFVMSGWQDGSTSRYRYAFTSSAATLERPDTGWRARSETTTRVWSEPDASGAAVFHYTATARAFVGSEDRPLAEKSVQGTIKQDWI
jgi:predicted acyl esterase